VSDSSRHEEQLRVGIDATPLLGNPTGVGTFCREAIGALATRSDVSLRAFAVTWRNHGQIRSLLPDSVTAAGRRMPARPLHAMWRHGNVPPIEWFVGSLDVVHGTNFVVPPAKRAASVVTVHDLTPLRFPELAERSSLAFPMLIRKAVQRGAWIHAVSEFVAAEVAESFAIDPSRVRAIPHGVPELPALDASVSHDIVSSYLPAGTTRYVLAVGTAEPRKDLPGLVRAFSELGAASTDVALLLVGRDGWGSAALEAAIAASPVRSRVVRIGWADPRHLAALVSGASVLAYPSIYEGFGLPPLQAMAAGVPVVATRTGAIPEILDDAALLVDVGDHDALADAVGRVLSDCELRERLRLAGLARSSSFTWQRCAEQLATLYRDAAADAGSRH
jgi:glycosyltransferase involved in cell wall biosynthesis